MSNDVYRLQNREGFALAFSNPGEDARNFIARLASEVRNNRAEGKNDRRLCGVDFDKLFHDVKKKGEMSSITLDGRLNLSGLDFSHINMEASKACEVDFSGSLFKCSVLDNVDFEGVRARGAVFDGSLMRGGNLRWSDLRDSTFLEGEWQSQVSGERPSEARYEAVSHTRVGGTDFTNSRLARIHAFGLDAKESIFRGTELERAKIERSDLTDSVFDKESNMKDSYVIKSKLISETINKAVTSGALMRNNQYIPVPTVDQMIKQHIRMPGMLKDSFEREVERVTKQMPKEMKQDYQSGLLVKAAVWAGAGAASGVAVAAVMSSPMVAPLLATGIVSAVALKNLTGAGVKAIVGELADRLNTVRGLYQKDGLSMQMLGKGVGVLFGFGQMVPKLTSEIDNMPEPESYMEMVHDGILAVVNTPGKLEALLKRMEVINDFGHLNKRRLNDTSTNSFTVVREIGKDWPEETAPFKVSLKDNGCMVANWRKSDGTMLCEVEYGPNGKPIHIFDYRSHQPMDLDNLHGEFAHFGKQRAIFEEFKEGVVRSCTGFNHQSHLSQISPDGTIFIRDKESNRVDNPYGPAVHRPSGEILYFDKGRRINKPLELGRDIHDIPDRAAAKGR